MIGEAPNRFPLLLPRFRSFAPLTILLPPSSLTPEKPSTPLSLSLSLQPYRIPLSRPVLLSRPTRPFLVGPARSCREDSLDSPGDYVSCYYSSLSEGTPALLFSLSLSLRPPLASVILFSSLLLGWDPLPRTNSRRISRLVLLSAHEEVPRR